jgi:small subunit ribosomal protein S4
MVAVSANQDEYKLNMANQCKQCRRERTKLFLKGDRCNSSKCAIVKRNYAPGIHGQRLAHTRLTGYGLQLREKREKQKAKKSYNLREKQFQNYFIQAMKKTGETGQNFVQMLEMRLDNVIYKSGWGKSMRSARQLVNHGHFQVNGKKVNIPSYQLKINDIITIKPKSQKAKAFNDLADRLKDREMPEWLFYDPKEISLKVVDFPRTEKMSLPFDLKAIIEFYSR